ncbi:MAG: permease-like cell division protein FtsX [Oscillibacter sp.]|nr:permease-like cell division protein FtsX [Oscillibacter sp.]
MGRRNFHYFLQEGLDNMFSHGFMTFAAVSITVACLLIMGTCSLVALNASANLKELEDSNEIVAFVDELYTPDQAKALEEKLLALPHVASAEFISRQDAMDSFRSKYPDESLFQDLDPAIFRDRYSIKLDALENLHAAVSQVRAVEGVADVNAYEDVANGFIAIRNVSSVISVTLIAALFLVSAFIISNTIRLTTFERREEIAIMRMVGATNGFIRWPFVYEGFFMGLISGAAAFLLQALLYALVARGVNSSDSLHLFHVVPFREYILPVGGAFLGAGILVGVGGSLTAIRRFLRV